MAEHFKYYPSDEATVTPWNARFSYPSQANKAEKLTPRIPPKNGSTFNPGQQIFMDFPAQGYVNPLNTMINMDVVLIGPTQGSPTPYAVRFQNNIQSIFNRVRLLYGGNEIEAMYNYNVIIRFLTETCATNQQAVMDGTSITDGVGGVVDGFLQNRSSANIAVSALSGDGTTITAVIANGVAEYPIDTYITIYGATIAAYNGTYLINGGNSTQVTFPGTATGSATGNSYHIVFQNGKVNARQAYIQGLEGNFGANLNVTYPPALQGFPTNGAGLGLVPNGSIQAMIPAGVSVGSAPFSVRRYQVNLALGLFTQDKLIPTKYMASQLRIELTLEQANACIYQPTGIASNLTPPTYAVGNVLLIPEIIEFDDTYDSQFLAGLEGGGIPIKISTWHWYQFTTSASSSLSLQIQERSRSVKGIVAIQRRGQAGFQYDSHALLYDSNPLANQPASQGTTMTDYQYRLGGRYYPGAPVQLAFNTGSSFTNGGSESFQEMQKFLNNVGDYRLQPNVNVLNWAVPAQISTNVNVLPEFDYSVAQFGWTTSGTQQLYVVEDANSAFAGNLPSCCYANCINFETSNGVEISGLNAEEQSDIAYVVRWSAPQASGFLIECYPYIDKMMVLRPNNVLELIE